MNNKCILKFKQEFVQIKDHFIQLYYRYEFQNKESGAGTRTIPDQYIQKKNEKS